MRGLLADMEGHQEGTEGHEEGTKSCDPLPANEGLQLRGLCFDSIYTKNCADIYFHNIYIHDIHSITSMVCFKYVFNRLQTTVILIVKNYLRSILEVTVLYSYTL